MDILKNNNFQVGIGLVIALMAIIYFNLPHTPCQSQVEIYVDAVKSIGKSFDKAAKDCKEHTDPGGCMPFMEGLKRLEGKYTEIGHQCQEALKTNEMTRLWITNSMEILVKSAWGSQPPINYGAKNGWLELTQLVEFCRLKNHLESVYGKEYWDEF